MKETHKKSQIQINPIDSLAIHLSSAVKRLDDEIKKNIQDKEVIVTNISSHLIMGKSKKIRPLLTLLFAKILKYKGNAHFNLAVCIEFIHNATLLHDDVVDYAKIRRGKKAANLIWGNKLSILVGDYLLSKSFKLMVKDKSIKVLEILSNTSLILARGQIQDANNISNISFSNILIRDKKPSDKCRYIGRNKENRLKILFQELNIPAAKRDFAKVIELDGKIIAVYPFFICH